MHGAYAPQNLRKAEERMRELVHPSLNRLAELVDHADQDSVSLNAVKYVLDWAGFRTETVATTDTSVTVTVSFDRAEDSSLSLPAAD